MPPIACSSSCLVQDWVAYSMAFIVSPGFALAKVIGSQSSVIIGSAASMAENE